MREAETAVVWDARAGRLAGVAARHRVAAAAALRLRPRRRPGAVVGGHAVPAVVEEGGPGDQRRHPAAARWSCSPTCRASTARPSRCAALQLEYGAEIGRAVVNFGGPIVFCVISRYHGGAFVVFSAAPQRRPGDARARGRARVGDRRRARRGRRVRPRGRRPHAQGRADRGARRADRRGRTAPSASGCARSATTRVDRGPRREARRARGGVRRDPQRRSARSRSARSTG